MNKILASHPDLIKKFGYLILGLAVAIIFFIDYFLVLRPQLRAFSSLGAKASGFTKDIKETRLNLNRIDSLKAEILTSQEKLGKAERSILPTADTAVITQHLLQLAEQYEVQVNQMTPAKESEAIVLKSDQGEYLGLPIVIDAEGGYHNIGLFFDHIENDETFMSIQSFQIAHNPRTIKKHLLTMTVMVFVLKKDQK